MVAILCVSVTDQGVTVLNFAFVKDKENLFQLLCHHTPSFYIIGLLG